MAREPLAREIASACFLLCCRIYPTFKLNASAGADLHNSERLKVRFQIDGQNLTNIVDVIDFGGLFSGNAIGPSRSVALRLTTNF